MPKISVIIPVYNVEKYLRDCLDSVVNQTLKDIEIICINDGSTDGSLAILREYEQKDSRIIVIDKENEGVSVARNVGIDKSTGEYLCFLDSDDWFEKDILEKSYDKINESNNDIVCFCIEEHFDNSVMLSDTYPIVEEHYNDMHLDIDVIKNFIIYIGGKLYRANFIKNNKIYFLENAKSCEDSIFHLFCIYKNAKWGLLKEIGYNYRKNREGAITKAPEYLIKTDIDSYKTLLQTGEFISASEENKILTIEKFMFGFRGCYSKKHAIENIKLIQDFKKYLYRNVDINILNKVPNIKDFSRYTYIRYIIQTIFSIKNCGQHKILTIIGIKIKWRRNYAEG